MRNQYESSNQKMTPEQIEAEKMAIAMLKKAQQLIIEGDQFAEEAQKIRDEATLELLPSHRMYILRKDSRSLLLDVDRRIQQAKFRNFSSTNCQFQQGSLPHVNGHFLNHKQNFLEKRKERRDQRYNQVAEISQQQHQKAVIWMVAIVLTSFILLYGLQQVMGPNVLYNSFAWLENYR